MLPAVAPDRTRLAAKLFRGFADPSRLAILQALRDGPRSVGQLVATTGLSQPNVSNHLACLRDCGLVASERVGRRVVVVVVVGAVHAAGRGRPGLRARRRSPGTASRRRSR